MLPSIGGFACWLQLPGRNSQLSVPGAVRKLHFGSSSSKVAACAGACGRLCVCVCAGALAIHLGGHISCTHVPTMHCRGALTGAVMATYSLGQKNAHTVQNRSAKRQLHVMRRYRFWGFAISFLRKNTKQATRNRRRHIL